MSVEKQNLESEVFGPDSSAAIFQIRQLLPRITGSVYDLPLDNFQIALRTCMKTARALYWHEIIGRTFLASVSSLIRNDQWIRGVVSACASGSYLGMCGSLRGLLEAAADSMYSLEFVPQTLANSWANVRNSLSAEEGPFVTCKELEDALIHFSHARKLKPPTEPQHVPLHVRGYIDIIKKFDPKLESLYEALCQLAHPAAPSLEWMVQTEFKDGFHEIVLIGEGASRSAISGFLCKYQAQLSSLVMAANNYPLVTLKLLRKLPEKHLDFDVKAMDTVDLSNLKIWKIIDAETNGIANG